MPNPQLECVLAQQQSSFRCEHRSCEAFEAEHPWHFHPEFELTWIIRSQGMRYIGDSIENYTANELVLCGPNLPHCWRNDSPRSGADRPQWIIAQFDQACFGPGFLDLPEAEAIRGMLHQALSGIVFAGDAVVEVGPLLRQLVERSGMSRLIGLLEILEALTRHKRRPLADTGYHLTNQVNQSLVDRLELVQRYIAENLSEEISQREIAAHLGMSASAFSKFFRAATGRTFMSLVKLLRINQACRLLTTTTERITEIGLSCGYQHTSHFDRHFREAMGMSPGEYRRRMLKLEAEVPAGELCLV